MENKRNIISSSFLSSFTPLTGCLIYNLVVRASCRARGPPGSPHTMEPPLDPPPPLGELPHHSSLVAPTPVVLHIPLQVRLSTLEVYMIIDPFLTIFARQATRDRALLDQCVVQRWVP